MLRSVHFEDLIKTFFSMAPVKKHGDTVSNLLKQIQKRTYRVFHFLYFLNHILISVNSCSVVVDEIWNNDLIMYKQPYSPVAYMTE